MGIVASPVLLSLSTYKTFDGYTHKKGAYAAVAGLLVFILPDGVSYHWSPKYRWDIAPYANIFGLEFIKNHSNNTHFLKYACSFGVKSTYIYNDFFTFSAFTETRQALRFGWGFGGGIGVGMLLGHKKEATVLPLI